MNRELDERVAKAMGWTVEWNKHGGVLLCRCEHEVRSLLPAYSIDCAALPEMMAWLQNRGSSIEMRWEFDSGWHVEHYNATTCASYGEVVGKTLNEAVANLVIAVAESEKERQPCR